MLLGRKIKDMFPTDEPTDLIEEHSSQKHFLTGKLFCTRHAQVALTVMPSLKTHAQMSYTGITQAQLSALRESDGLLDMLLMMLF